MLFSDEILAGMSDHESWEAANAVSEY